MFNFYHIISSFIVTFHIINESFIVYCLKRIQTKSAESPA